MGAASLPAQSVTEPPIPGERPERTPRSALLRLRRLAASLLPFLFTLAILVARAWPRLMMPDLWAEDGRVFTAQALRLGWESLLVPMHGSFFVLQRLVVLLSLELLPMAWLPAVIAWACVVLTAAVFARIVHRDFEWMLPDAGLRWALAGLFCLAPGLAEMLGNLCNTNWILFCWVSLQGLRDPQRRPGLPALLLTAAAVLSMGTSILLVPLFLWRFALVLRSGHRDRLARDAAQLGIVVLSVGLILAGGDPKAKSADPLSAAALFSAWSGHLVQLAFLTPWLGDRLTARLYAPGFETLQAAAAALTGVFLAGLAWTLRRRPWVPGLVLWGLATSLWTVLASVVRTNALYILGSIHDQRLYQNRYAFIVSFVALLWWCALLGGLRLRGRPVRALAAALAAIVVFTSLHRFRVPAYGVEARWRNSVALLQSSVHTGCPRIVVAPLYPDGWNLGYTSMREVACP